MHLFSKMRLMIFQLIPMLLLFPARAVHPAVSCKTSSAMAPPRGCTWRGSSAQPGAPAASCGTSSHPRNQHGCPAAAGDAPPAASLALGALDWVTRVHVPRCAPPILLLAVQFAVCGAWCDHRCQCCMVATVVRCFCTAQAVCATPPQACLATLLAVGRGCLQTVRQGVGSFSPPPGQTCAAYQGTPASRRL